MALVNESTKIIDTVTESKRIIVNDIWNAEDLNVKYNFKMTMHKRDRKKHPKELLQMNPTVCQYRASSKTYANDQHIVLEHAQKELTIKHAFNSLLVCGLCFILIIAVMQIAHCSSNKMEEIIVTMEITAGDEESISRLR